MSDKLGLEPKIKKLQTVKERKTEGTIPQSSFDGNESLASPITRDAGKETELKTTSPTPKKESPNKI